MSVIDRALVALTGAALLGGAAAAQVQPLQPADLFQLEAAASPRISPDGRQIAYLRNRNDINTDRTVGSLWLIDADGSDHLPLVTGAMSVSSPRWSPSGDRIAYVSSRDGRSVLRMIWMEDGRDAEIAVLPAGASGLRWSPQGDRLAFASFRPAPGAAAAPLPPAPPGSEWAAGARVEERLVYRIDGIGPVPNGNQQIFIVDAEGGAPVQVSQGPLTASGDFSWSPDGGALVFSADRRPDSDTAAPDSELHLLDLAGGQTVQLTDRIGPDNSPRISPDGELIAYLGYDDRRMGYHNSELWVMPVDGGEPRSLTADLDRSVSNPQWSRDGRGVYVQYDDRGDRRIAYVTLDGEVRNRTTGTGPAAFGRPYTGGGFTVSRDGRIATTVSTPARPAELAVSGRRGGLNVIARLNEDLLARRTVGQVEEVIWESSHDGREIQGWAMYPPDFDPEQDYPLILEIHGGPFSAYAPVFSMEFQLMAAQGYVVFYTNPRGSTSYGYEFANLIHHNYPGQDYDDLMSGVDAMIARGSIDEDRLFVTGGSGGGVLTAWIVGNTDRFAASVVAKPVINWASFVLYSDFPAFFYRYWFSAPPWEDPDQYWRRSPLSLVGEVDTPTMLMVGGSDVRTPVAETEQYYSALRLRGVPTRLVVIPDSFHGIANSRPSRLLTKVAEILRWFEEHDPANGAAE
jgi:acylaminoacyl-peptidase